MMKHVISILFVLVISTVSHAQQANIPIDTTESQITPTPAASTITLSTETIEAKRKDIASQLEIAQKNLESINENTPPEISDRQKQIVQLLGQYDMLLNLQLGLLQQIEAHKTTELQLKDQFQQLRTNGPVEKPPYSYLLLESLRSQVTTEKEKGTTIDNSLKAAQDALDQMKKIADEKENTRRLMKESVDKNQDETAVPLLTLRLRIAQLEAQASQEAVNLRKLEQINQKATKSSYDAQLALLQERVKWIEKDAEFLEKDLKDQFVVLDTDKTTLSNDLKKAEDNLKLVQKKLESSQDRLAKSPEQTAALVEDEKALRYERDYYQEEVGILPKRLARIEDRRQVWQRRFDTINKTATMKDLNTWPSESNSRIAMYDTEKGLYNSTLASIRKDLGSVTEKIDQVQDDKTVLAKLKAQQDWLQKRISLIEDNVSRIDSMRRFHEKLISEIKQETQQWSWDETLQFVKIKLNSFLDYSVWSNKKVEEEEEAILTVGKIVTALIYLIVGLFLARVLSRYGIRIFFSRLGVHEGATVALQSLSYYLFFIIVFYYTFRVINISLTAFAFLGGALAIGIGFGSQNILNNFISGIILLIERPIRVGDMIEVDGVAGTVVSIGARCTRLQTFSNVDHLIPNSSFLESKVINLTLEDTIIRTIVSVGVAYGSDIRKVFQLIKKTVEEHGLICKHPDPYVTLTEFGDNAIQFEVRFWLDMNKANRLIIESDVRHRIYNLFDEAGIVIAYPQRDIHLDTQRPLEIRMLPSASNHDISPQE